MNQSVHLGARVAAAGLGGAAAGTFTGAVGFILGQQWYGTSLFIFQPTPGLAGLVGTALVGVLGCAVGLLIGLLGGRFVVVNAVLGSFIGLVVASYEVLANAARFTAYELTLSLTVLVACLLAALAAGGVCQALANRDKIVSAAPNRPDQH
jgi:hypothetical protein